MQRDMRTDIGSHRFMMCEECSGQGYVEIGPDCDLPASMCCGGCYKKVKCETCKGKGYEKQEADNQGE
jgi:hypothetical protein